MNEYIQDTLSTPSILLQQHKYIELIVSLASLIIFFCDGTLSDIYDKKNNAKLATAGAQQHTRSVRGET